jgi:hypothetical protein
MSGTVTVEEISDGSVKRIVFTWTSDASGNATKTTVNSYTGSLTDAIFAPGTPTPTTAYDVVVNNASSSDRLGGAGANLSSAATVYKASGDGLTTVADSTLSLSITNAGDSKQGTITLYLFGTSNAYCSLANIKDRLNPLGMAVNAVDDAVIVDMIEQTSRAIDLFCNKTFYARTSETRYFNLPDDNQLDFDDSLLTLTTLTNGNGDVISASDYLLQDINRKPYYAVKLKPTSGIVWLPAGTGEFEQVITVLGTWGYVDRAATDFLSARVIQNTKHCCIETVLAVYKSRFGENTTGVATVTAAGIVITPRDIPDFAMKYLEAYMPLH